LACPRLEDRPSDLGPPFSGGVGLEAVDEVELPYRSVDTDLMLLDVGPEGTVGPVDIVVRACVQGDGKLSGGDDDSRYAADRSRRFSDRDEDGRVAFLLRE